MAFIEIQNLFKRYKKVVAVNHIQLEVNEGELLTLLGPSGCVSIRADYDTPTHRARPTVDVREVRIMERWAALAGCRCSAVMLW